MFEQESPNSMNNKNKRAASVFNPTRDVCLPNDCQSDIRDESSVPPNKKYKNRKYNFS